MKSSLKHLILVAIVLNIIECTASSHSDETSLYKCIYSENSESVQCSQSSLVSDSSFLQETDTATPQA